MIFELMTRFRANKVARTADIEKAFLNVSIAPEHHTCPIHRHNEIVMRFLVRHNRHHKASQSVPYFMSRKAVTTFLRIKVEGHFVMSIVKCYESHYVGVLDNPRMTWLLQSLMYLQPKTSTPNSGKDSRKLASTCASG